MADPVQKGSQQRVLEVAQSLVMNGPSTIDDISAGIGIPRSSVHRALHSLAQSGWVHRNLSKVRYMISGDLQRQFSRGLAGPPRLDALAEILVQLEIKAGYHLDLAKWESGDKPYMIDSTEKTAPIGQPLSAVQDPVARVLVCAMPGELKLQRLTRYLKTAPDSDVAASRKADFAQLFRFQDDREYLWDPRVGSICMVAKVDDVLLGLNLRPRQTNAQLGTRFRDDMLVKIRALRDALQAL